MRSDVELKAGVFDPPRAAPDFSLKGSDGGELKLSRYRSGKVVVLGFGFTHCPEVCPTTLATLAKARKKLGSSAGGMQVVYVTVDPQRDDPGRMRSYLAVFDPSFIGATRHARGAGQGGGRTMVSSRRRWKGKGPEDYGFDHSSFVYLIDRAGSLRALSPYGRGAEDIAHDVAVLLKK
jgi:protein SCO1/2